jgi:hypothetical protein
VIHDIVAIELTLSEKPFYRIKHFHRPIPFYVDRTAMGNSHGLG